MRGRTPKSTREQAVKAGIGLYEREALSISKLAHLRFFPLAATGGTGSSLRADDGRILIDFSASWGAAVLGHSHPAIRAAVDRALSDQAGASYLSCANSTTTELAEMLLQRVPSRAAGRVWFGHSGSDANETANRAIRSATGRSGILAFDGSYHGGTVGSIAISGHPSQQQGRSDYVTLITFPNELVDGKEAAASALAELDIALAERPDYFAAFFIEPIQSDGGMLVPPDGFLQTVQERCRKHSILLVADEVKVGLGRTGTFNAHENFDVEPDVVVLGKGLGGGMPISAVIGPEWLMNHASAFSFQTLHGNPVCAAAAIAVLQTIDREKLLRHSAKLGYHIREMLKEVASRQSAICDVRGVGLALGIEIKGEALKGRNPRDITARIVYRAFQLGLVVYYVGVKSNVIELTPPLNISHEEAARGVALLEQAIDDVINSVIDLPGCENFAGW